MVEAVWAVMRLSEDERKSVVRSSLVGPNGSTYRAVPFSTPA